MTLVETLAAIVIFSIVTLGVVPLLAGALRGSQLARTSTAGKNIAVEAMERVRGLPYYLSEAREAGDVDILDLYYPGQPNANSGRSYRTVCTSGDSSPACPPGRLPNGYSLVYVATFRNAANTIVIPRDTYDSDPDAVGETDAPPAGLLDIGITVSWLHRGLDRSFTLQSIVGNRKFGEDKLRAQATLDYTVSVTTTFPTSPEETTLTVIAGTGESSMQSRTTTVAATRMLAASAQTAAGGVAADAVEGTAALLEAPPDDSATGGAVDPTALILDGYVVADIEGASYSGPPSNPTTAVHVGGAPEYARGGFSFPTSSTLGNVWVDKAVLRGAASPLRLLDGAKLISVGPTSAPGNVGPLRGFTSVTAQLATSTGVTSEASGSVNRVRILPTDFAPTGVIQLQGFTSRVRCNSVSLGIPDIPIAEWSADLFFTYDTAEGGTARTPVTVALSSASGTDPLSAYRPVATTADVRDLSNPMIFEDTTSAGIQVNNSHPNDVYLFPQSHTHTGGVVHNHRGYIQSWQSRVGVSTRVGDENDPSSASIDEVVGIATRPLVTATGTSPAIFISLGSMSCEALDQR